MQTFKQTESIVMNLLKDELDLFKRILSETNEIAGHIDGISVDTILNLLNARKQWIEELALLEDKRTALSVNSPRSESLIREITDITKELIAIDAKIFDYLRIKKENVIKDLVKIADNKNRSKNNRYLRSKSSRIVDIVQE
ncbi:MAG: hypothetical protein J7L22_06005 [Candidatus Marinimicrobia bacterium]|nr:hypothetical protein [Candidatus Neomarinimicrobiota bacterium]RKY60497.1 MAG: hypothetical protein DRP96_05660 [Candidatus Neomarinimicrobiota bacterium]